MSTESAVHGRPLDSDEDDDRDMPVTRPSRRVDRPRRDSPTEAISDNQGRESPERPKTAPKRPTKELTTEERQDATDREGDGAGSTGRVTIQSQSFANGSDGLAESQNNGLTADVAAEADSDGGDENEEDEEDEEDEDGDEDGERPVKRSRQERPRNQFLDVEAEVDEDDDVDEDDEDPEEGDGFIQEVEDAAEMAANQRPEDDRHHRELDRQRQAIAEEDAERLAEEYRAKYGRSSASFAFRGDTSTVPQRLLLPSVDDPSIWGVRCKTGKEKDIVDLLMRKREANQFTSHPLEISAVFQRDGLSGYIYLEARKQAHVLEALRGIVSVYASRLILVSIDEMADLLRVNKSKSSELLPGAYVRIRKGRYAGDIAQVENLSENGLEARLRIVPRLDFSTRREDELIVGADGKRKRVINALTNRKPPQRLFSAQDAVKAGSKQVQKRGPSNYIYNGEEYDEGYLLKDLKLNNLIIDGVNPSLEEITKFSGGNDDAENGIDLTSLVNSIKASAAESTFQPGDHVKVFQGEQTSITGVVDSVAGDIVTLRPVNLGDSGTETIEIPSRNLQKQFNQGDHVKVTAGKYKDETGMVVRVPSEGDTVTIVSDASMTEITVFSKDVRESSDIGGSNVLGAYQLHDLIALDINTVACITKVERESFRVIDQNGKSRTIMPSQISMKMQNKFSVATDRDGSEVRVGDTVKEMDGDSRQGTILHIYRAFLFLHNRVYVENSGVFVARARSVATIAAKGARVTTGGTDLNKMNPNFQVHGAAAGMMQQPRPSGRDRAIGASVTIKKGGYKGLIGIVKDTTDQHARVELHSKSKIVTVEKDKLAFKDPKTGISINYAEYCFPRKSAAAPPDMTAVQSTLDGGRTPAWASGARTPAYGGRTPAWASGTRTPAYGDSSRTPTWSGNRTPGYYQDGSRTPAFNPSSRTPGYGDGNRTPTYGGMTPARGGESVWNAGSRTPGRQTSAWDEPFGGGGYSSYNSAPWDDVHAAATPGSYSATTPGATTSNLPPAWASSAAKAPWEEASTPYAAQTPGAYSSAATPMASHWSGEPEYAPASP